jgi:hypothetical protein
MKSLKIQYKQLCVLYIYTMDDPSGKIFLCTIGAGLIGLLTYYNVLPTDEHDTPVCLNVTNDIDDDVSKNINDTVSENINDNVSRNIDDNVSRNIDDTVPNAWENFWKTQYDINRPD